MTTKWLENSWYQAAWSDEIAPGSRIVRTILDQPILLYRSESGGLSALLDRCPHRFAPLSAGQIDGNRVTCGYHGLAFAPSGECVNNPHGPVTSAMRVRSYPLIERHTAAWIWMGDPAQADPSAIPDLSFIDDTPEPARISGYMPTKCDFQLLTDNILDLSHADYLHPTTLGGMMSSSKARSWEEADGRIVAEWVAAECDPPPTFRAMVPEGKADISFQVVWCAPAVMKLTAVATSAGVPRTDADETCALHNMVPETATSSHYFFCATRRFQVQDEQLSALFRKAVTQAFENEDKPMLEKQQMRMGAGDFWSHDPVLLSVDAAAVRVRRKLAKMIEDEQADKAIGAKG